jgi:hypothetical protein
VRVGNVLSIRAIVLNRTIAGSACVVSLLLAGCGQTTLRNAELGPRPVIGPLLLQRWKGLRRHRIRSPWPSMISPTLRDSGGLAG